MFPIVQPKSDYPALVHSRPSTLLEQNLPFGNGIVNSSTIFPHLLIGGGQIPIQVGF